MKAPDSEELHAARSVFSPEGLVLITVLKKVLGAIRKYRYSFMPQVEFDALLASDLTKASQVYWLEILYRAHFSALTALLRSTRWIDGIVAAYRRDNLLALAASYRALIESAADNQDAFGLAVPTIAEYCGPIRAAIQGNATTLHIVDRLEDTLIHFMYGRRLRRGETAPDSHKAKHTSDYLGLLKRGCGEDVLQCYADLCNLTHPAALSVLAYAKSHGDGFLIDYWPDADRSRINDLCLRYVVVAPQVLMFAINNGLTMLKLLNRFAHRAIYTPVMDEVDLSGIPAWVKAEQQVAKFDIKQE